MTLPKNVAELQGENVVLELECIDRMYLNLYVPELTSAQGVAAYFRGYKGHRFASTKEAVAMSEGFRRQVFDFAERHAQRPRRIVVREPCNTHHAERRNLEAGPDLYRFNVEGEFHRKGLRPDGPIP